MEHPRAFDGVAFQECFAAGDVFDDFSGNIFPRKQQTKERLVERGIIKQRIKNLRRRVIEQRLQLVAGGEVGTIALLFQKRQVRFLTQAVEAGAPDARQPPRG